QNFSVRTCAAQTIDTIRWIPKEREERVSFYVAKGWFERAASTGVDAIPALQLTLQTAPVSAAVRAVDALGRIPDPSVVKLLCGALHSPEPAVCIAATDSLGKIGGTEAVEALTGCLRNSMGQIRAAAAQALGILGAAEATAQICQLLTDKEWE